jgi:hypothetical protein
VEDDILAWMAVVAVPKPPSPKNSITAALFHDHSLAD